MKFSNIAVSRESQALVAPGEYNPVGTPNMVPCQLDMSGPTAAQRHNRGNKMEGLGFFLLHVHQKIMLRKEKLMVNRTENLSEVTVNRSDLTTFNVQDFFQKQFA